MLDYNKLFDVAYSDTLPEAVKASIFENVLESIGAELNESLQTEDSYYVSFLNTLINSTITEACLSDIIETTFNSLSEAEIENLTEEFIKASVVSYISEAGFGTPRPIGLTGLRKELDRREGKAPQPQATKPSAMDRLKSAVGKVKSWVDKVRDINRPSTMAGINKLQAQKDARIKKAVEMGTGPKKEPKPEEPKPEEPKPDDTPQPPAYRTEVYREPVKKAVEMGTGPKKEPKPDDTPQPPAYRTEVKAEEPKVEKTEAPKAEKKTTKKATTKKTTKKTKELKVEEPKVETPTAKKNTSKKVTKKTSTKKADSVAKSVANAVTPKSSKKKTTKKKAVKVARKPKNTNEAIADMLCVLANTNISEAAVEEIVEMISNKKAAKKAVDKEYKEFTKAADALNKAEEVSAKTNIPLNPELRDKLIKKAEKKGERYEHFKALADKKFGS
jgi:hypothetical protein